MTINMRNLVFIALQATFAALTARPANAQAQPDRLEALIRAQAVQIEKLTREMNELRARQSERSPQAETAAHRAEKASRPAESATEAVAPRPVKTPGAVGSPQNPVYVLAGDKKLSWKLPGSDVSLRIGGYAKLDAIGITGGNRSVGSSDLFNPVAIQTRGNPTGTAPGDPSTRIHGRQSRIFLEASKTDTPFGPARAYIEADFFGPIDLGTETVSNSNTFRLRHAYGEVGPLLGGQTWSTFSDPTSYPEILDFQGPGAQSFIRQGQVRYTGNFGGGLTGSVAVENPESRIRIGTGPVTGTGTPGLASGLQSLGVGPFARDSTPDFVARIRYESPQVNFQLSGVATRSTAPLPIGSAPVVGGSGNFGFGTLAAGQIAIPFFNKKDNFRFQAGYLDGASRYIQDVAGSAPSFAYNATLTQFDSIVAYGGFGAFQHWWTDALRTNLTYSIVRINNPVFSGVAVVRETQYATINLLYSPWADVDLGSEFQYGQREDADRRKGNQTRVQSSLIYRF